jgi:hypothetical protein
VAAGKWCRSLASLLLLLARVRGGIRDGRTGGQWKSKLPERSIGLHENELSRGTTVIRKPVNTLPGSLRAQTGEEND